MVSILLVAHAPLATSLQAVAGHAFAECSGQVFAVDIEPSASVEVAEGQIVAALATLMERGTGAEVLVLADTFGATPCNAAVNVVDGSSARVVSGVNVPMLWRSLCYRGLPLDEVVARAVEGGRQGIMQVAATRRQDQHKQPASNEADSNFDQ